MAQPYLSPNGLQTLSWICCDHITMDLVLSLLWSNNERSLFSWLSLASPNGLTGLVPGFVVVVIQALKFLLEPQLPDLWLWSYRRHESAFLMASIGLAILILHQSFVTIARMWNRPFWLMDGATLSSSGFTLPQFDNYLMNILTVVCIYMFQASLYSQWWKLFWYKSTIIQTVCLLCFNV